MRLVYAPRAVRDLRSIGAYYRSATDEKTAEGVAARIERLIDLIVRHPYIAPRLRRRPDVRSASVVRYPYIVFYRIRGDAVEILHIRHSARRPWEADA
jgi:plasmid stabilization system protein ParE